MSEDENVLVPRISLAELEEHGVALNTALQRHSFVILGDLSQSDIETVCSKFCPLRGLR